MSRPPLCGREMLQVILRKLTVPGQFSDGSASIHRRKAGQRLHPGNPRKDVRIIAEAKAAFFGDMGIGEQRNVGEGHGCLLYTSDAADE